MHLSPRNRNVGSEIADDVEEKTQNILNKPEDVENVTDACTRMHSAAPSTLNTQPSTINPQPSTLNPQPSTLNIKNVTDTCTRMHSAAPFLFFSLLFFFFRLPRLSKPSSSSSDACEINSSVQPLSAVSAVRVLLSPDVSEYCDPRGGRLRLSCHRPHGQNHDIAIAKCNQIDVIERKDGNPHRNG
jgi:hypothetical protein